ncbi:MAG: Mov34/MPN/PAD-1 family protein [Thermodesulfobacteriota bacterium]
MVVKISSSAYNGMIENSEQGYPYEVCGVMIGKDNIISHFKKCKNLVNEDAIQTEWKSEKELDKSRMKDRFELDPKSFLEADNWARENGLEILGIYHSHPDHPSKPSETDREVASPGWGYIIFSINNGKYNDARIWYIRESDFQFEEKEFEVVEG